MIGRRTANIIIIIIIIITARSNAFLLSDLSDSSSNEEISRSPSLSLFRIEDQRSVLASITN